MIRNSGTRFCDKIMLKHLPWRMIRKSGTRFCDKIMLRHKP